MCELHVIGQLEGAEGFSQGNLFCIWEFLTSAARTASESEQDGAASPLARREGEILPAAAAATTATTAGGILVVEGDTKGQTHVIENPQDAVWAHPIDIHYYCPSKDVFQWPKVAVEVWFQDAYGRCDILGYGVAYLPVPPPPAPQGGVLPEFEVADVLTGSTGGTGGSVYSAHLNIVTWIPALSVMQQIRSLLLGGRPQLRDRTLIWNPESRHRLKTMGSGTVRFKLNIIYKKSKPPP